jgi:chromosomal replication initiator protein
MTATALEVWSRLLERARLEVPEQTLRTWLEPSEPLEFDGSVLHLGTPDQFAADWNDSKYASLLSSLAPIALGYPVQVRFRVQDEAKSRPQMDLFVAPPPQEAATIKKQHEASTASLSSRYTFDNFVIGKSNELAAAAASAVAQAPGRVYNPLFIYGDTGLGKTHLMQAVAHEILQRAPGTRLIFIGTEQFTNEYVAALGSRTMSEFRRRFRETDLLLVDDVHFLKGKESTQEEFFHTFNALYEAGRQIIMTSDRPPSEIRGVESRLVSRFQWGMVADIDLPDLEHRVAILRQKARREHLDQTIPEAVLQFIAENVRSSVRELEGSVIKLLAYASLKRREISIELAREALRDKLRSSVTAADLGVPGAQGPTPALIQQLVATAWGVTTDGLTSKTRTKTLTIPRQIAMFLCRELLGLQLVEIGNLFGGRDHSTVIHSLERANELVASDPTISSRVDQLRARLSSFSTA